MILQEIPPIESLTATSIMGWGGFLFGFIACVILIWDRVIGRGKSLADVDNKLDKMCKQIEDMAGELVVVDGLGKSVAELVYEWRGVDGNNGYKSIIRDNQRRIGQIEKRNDRLDAVREEDERRSGGLHRRAIDYELDRILPEKGKQ